ncbi:hypothetical protein POUND7_006430 [Theobroma cacao]
MPHATLQESFFLWEDILSLRSDFPMSWCCAGDFNIVKSIEERKRCSQSGTDISYFNDFIDSSELTDLPLVGKKFTRYGVEAKRNRIDRFPLSLEWFLQFQNLSQKGDFYETVAENWNSTVSYGNAGHCLKVKLNRLKSQLKQWNRPTFGNIDTTIADLENTIEQLDK